MIPHNPQTRSDVAASPTSCLALCIVLRRVVHYVALAALASASQTTFAQSSKTHRPRFEGVWKTIKGHEGREWGEPQTITIRRHGNTYDAYGSPTFNAIGPPTPHLILRGIKGGQVLEYTVLFKSHIPRYYDLKLSADGRTLTSIHHSRFGLFGGATYARGVGKSVRQARFGAKK